MRWTTITLAAALVSAAQLSAQAKFKVLHNFGSPSDGNVPSGPLLMDAHGNLYGGTFAGGQHGDGAIFELIPQGNGSWREQVLYSFLAGSNGAYPWGALLLGGPTSLYGTIQGYGSHAVGGVFELTHGVSGWNYSLLYSSGAGPGVVFDKLGNLYGALGPGKIQPRRHR